MENNRQKWISLSYLAVSALTAFILFYFATKVVAVYDLETRVKQIDLILRGVSIAVGAGLFLYLFRNAQTNQFMDEVVAEFSKVSWPTQKETMRATAVVIVMVLISSALLGALDSVWSWVLKLIF